MRPTQILRSGGGPELGKYGNFYGNWGAFGGPKWKGIASYGLSLNQQRPLAGAFHNAIFNTWRRFYSQVWYWAPPMALAYYAITWANSRNEYLNSKAGRLEYADSE